MKLTNQELSTILAALRYYQAEGMGDPGNRPNWLHEIATDEGNNISMDEDGIDELCEKLNLSGFIYGTTPDEEEEP